MKTYDRYVMRLFGSSLAATIIFLCGLYLLIHFVTHLDHHEDAREAFGQAGYRTLFVGLCSYYASHLPEIVVLFGPYALLLASMYAVHQLNQGNELVPMFAVGVTRLRIAAPLFFVATAVAAGLVAVREEIIPPRAREMEILSRLMRGKERPVTDDVNLMRDRRGFVFDAARWDAAERALEDVHVFAADGREWHFSRLVWSERDGAFLPPGGEEPQGLDLAAASDLTPFDVDYEQRMLQRLSFLQLRRLHARNPDDRRIEVLMHDHVTYVLVPIVLMMLGLPLVMRHRRQGAVWGIGQCLLLGLGFFTVRLILQRMGIDGAIVNPALGAWLPIIVFGTAGLILFELEG